MVQCFFCNKEKDMRHECTKIGEKQICKSCMSRLSQMVFFFKGE